MQAFQLELLQFTILALHFCIKQEIIVPCAYVKNAELKLTHLCLSINFVIDTTEFVTSFEVYYGRSRLTSGLNLLPCV